MVKIIEFLTNMFSKLPADPFTTYLTELDSTLSQYLGYLNWFLPIKQIADVTALWVTAIIASNVFMAIYNLFIKKIAG